MVDSQQSKGYRVLSMFDRLMDGQGINKKQEALTHQVGEKTIQRDINQIRVYIEKAKLDCYLQYVRTEKVYKLMETNNNRLSKEQVLAIVKILIDSRALIKSEMSDIIDKLISIVVADEQEHMMLNEKHLYIDVHHKKSLLPLIWRISKAIQKKKVITIDYVYEGEDTPTEKILKPIAVMYSESHFYLITEEQDSPIVYRIDRIRHFRELDKRFQIPYTEQFQEEEFRKRMQFMHTGELIHIRFFYKGKSPQTVLERLPTAKLLAQKESEYFFEAEVFGMGIKSWLLSQGATIEVLEPIELREEIIEAIQTMQQNYRYM
ncbi:helix-turn-helix transcriptional regulator [Lysinibacillus cavernae]|uniref:helix-turn-helix transcriptional regulator n=1 Tax=Lysinibacillus cavernae TaxID=2666135 RepID=UPI0012D9ACA5|nr:WYL domain-containing protein [Lysinibacillus cavernae]